MYFWAYCIVISVWIIFWAWASFLAVVIAKFLLIVLTIVCFISLIIDTIRGLEKYAQA